MSIQVMGWAMEQSDVPARPALVLMALANHTNHVDGRAWCFIDTIAKEARCSRRAVFGYVAALERNGYVEVVRTRKKSGRQGANNYFLRFDRSPAPWSHFHQDDPEPPISPEDAEAVEAEEAAADPPDIVSRVQVEHPGNPTPECKADAPGQSATVCTRHVMPEPLDSITSEQVEGPALHIGVPSGYRPKARTEQAASAMAIDDDKPKPQFAWVGSRAWESWVRNGHKPSLTTVFEGRRGWWFRSLYPPKTTGPPSNLTAADESALANEMG